MKINKEHLKTAIESINSAKFSDDLIFRPKEDGISLETYSNVGTGACDYFLHATELGFSSPFIVSISKLSIICEDGIQSIDCSNDDWLQVNSFKCRKKYIEVLPSLDSNTTIANLEMTAPIIDLLKRLSRSRDSSNLGIDAISAGLNILPGYDLFGKSDDSVIALFLHQAGHRVIFCKMPWTGVESPYSIPFDLVDRHAEISILELGSRFASIVNPGISKISLRTVETNGINPGEALFKKQSYPHRSFVISEHMTRDLDKIKRLADRSKDIVIKGKDYKVSIEYVSDFVQVGGALEYKVQDKLEDFTFKASIDNFCGTLAAFGENVKMCYTEGAENFVYLDDGQIFAAIAGVV